MNHHDTVNLVNPVNPVNPVKHRGQWVDVDAPGSATSAATMIDEA